MAQQGFREEEDELRGITSVHTFDHKQDHGPAFGNRGVFAFGERGTVYCIRHGTVVLANALT